MRKIRKRDGTLVKFDANKIIEAINKASISVTGNPNNRIANNIAEKIESKAIESKHPLTVEEIQSYVEYYLLNSSKKDIAKAYVLYRDEKMRLRENPLDKVVSGIIEATDDYWVNENSNKNIMLASTQRDYMAGAISTDISKRNLLPSDIIKAHDDGLIHFHDMDYFAQHIHNCALINLEDMLQNGTVISEKLIEKPKSFSTACNIATQIMAVFASGQYGGQTVYLSHLAPFVDVSRKRIAKELEEECERTGIKLEEDVKTKIVEMRLEREVHKGVEIMQYQINTLCTTNGQTPFVSIFIYLGECENELTKKDLALITREMFEQRIQGIKNEKGVWITPAFPKLLYVLEKDNIEEDSPYYWLTKLAAKCTAKRMVPDYISEKIMMELKGDVYGCMGCRSFLTPDRTTESVGNIAKALNYNKDKHKYVGRFNQGVVTVNLPDIALTSKKEKRDFWEVFDERMSLCHKALRCRHERLLGTPSDVSPIHWQYGGLARLEKGEKIDKLLYDGYSTISLGFAGLWECVLAYTGEKLTTENGREFGLQVMHKLNDYTAKWKAEENIDYSLYGTPLESTTYKFAKCLKNRFGVIEGVTDKDYITNSYHIHVTEPIDAFSKLKFESEFQELSPGGAISYIETPNLNNNLEVVMSVIKFIYENIMYAELNIKSDYCQVCGYDGEIEIVEKDDGKLDWRCPNCGNMDHGKLNIARRTCGYIGTQFWNQGRTQEIKERVVHL